MTLSEMLREEPGKKQRGLSYLDNAADLIDELVGALEDAVEFDSHDDYGVEAVWLDKANAALAKARK